MALTLTIENEPRLPDGGPLSVKVSGRRGIDIGRDQHLDWTLPDATRAISGKHCEIRYHDGGYWLHDVSTNGTFLNGGERRMQGPHQLRHGDRLEIGHYIILVAIEGEGAPASAPSPPPAVAQPREFWSGIDDAAPPIPARDLQPPRQLRPVRPDFLDWAIDSPDVVAAPPERAPQPAPLPRAGPGDFGDMLWAQGPTVAAPEPEPIPPIPTPRRPPAPSEADSPWGLPSFAPVPAERRLRREPDQRVEAPPPPEPAPARIAPSRPAAPAPGSAGEAGGSTEFVRRLAKGAGVPEDVFARGDPGELAEELGALMRLVVGDLKQLLAARAQSKRLARGSNQTTIQALDNNPLKFSPTPEDALRIMFGPATSGYLDARRALEQSFRDLKTHQVKTYSAMQHALRMLVEDLDPQAIEEAAEGERGLGGLIGSRKGRLWDAYVARWEAKTAPHEDGLVDAFMLYFSECYERGGGAR